MLLLFKHEQRKLSSIVNKSAIIFLAALILLSSVPFSIALAVGSSDANPVNNAKAHMYYTAMQDCILNQKANTHTSSGLGSEVIMNESDANSGKWFTNGYAAGLNPTNPHIGYFANANGLSSDNDIVGCGGDNTDWILDAAKVWGYDSPVKALCQFGMVRVNGGDCYTGSGDLKIENGFNYNENTLRIEDFIKNVKTSTELSEAGKYIMYRDVFFVGCLGDRNRQPEPNAADGDYTYTISTYSTSDGKATTTKYTASNNYRKKTDTINYAEQSNSTATTSNPTGSTNFEKVSDTCEAIASKLTPEAANALAAFDKANPGVLKSEEDKALGNSAEDSGSSCGIEGIGWIVCPIVNFLAKISDQAFNFLSNNFLYISPKLLDTSNTNSTYKAWSVMRNIANVAFVIAFLVIIFSQITNIGISNYGIKKMLPRLVIAAILVNLSYIICQIAVDLSNIIGYSMSNILTSIGNSAAGEKLNTAEASMGWWSEESSGFIGISGKVLAGAAAGGVIYMNLAVLIPILIAAFFSLVMILFILVARQAIVILLIVIAPLAFVAYILPNTEKLFEKWRKTLTSMLVLFPVVSLIFGTSCMAAKIIGSTFGPSNTNDTSNVFGQITAAGIMVLPLFLVPGILKKSLDAVGTLGTKLNNFGSKIGNSVGKPLGESYNNSALSYKNTAFARGRTARKSYRKDYLDQAYAKNISNPNRSKFSKLMSNGVPITKAGRYASDSLQRAAQADANKANERDVANEILSLRSQFTPDKMTSGVAEIYEKAIRDNDITKALAAQDILLNSGGTGIENIHKTIKKLDDENGSAKAPAGKEELMSAIFKDINKANLKAKNNALATRAYTEKKLSEIATESKTYEGLTPTELVGQSANLLKEATDGGAVIDKTKAETVLNNPNTRAMIDTKEKYDIFEKAARR